VKVQRLAQIVSGPPEAGFFRRDGAVRLRPFKQSSGEPGDHKRQSKRLAHVFEPHCAERIDLKPLMASNGRPKGWKVHE